ncbi:MAG: LacI family DNA-binding transcriptional regulator [Bacteroides sp.]|nr:LacI family DNA-binding transcriptional regulator [Bacteroides sp.]
MSHATIKDIAKYLSVSTATVSRALSGDKNIRSETRDKVLEAAQLLGYKSNPVGKNLQSGRTNTVGVIIPEIVTPFFLRIVEGIQDVLYAKGLKVIIAQSGEDPVRERENLQMLDRFMVDGIIIGLAHKDKNRDEYLRLMNEGIPMVFYDRKPSGIDVTQVLVDDYMKTFFLIEHLIRSGRKKIAHVKAPSYMYSSAERLRGYKDALAKFKLPFEESWVVECSGMGYEDGKNAFRVLQERGVGFDAIFAFTDTVAIGGMNYLHRQGIRIPEDVAVASFSGTEISEIVHPSLTTVEQPRFKMGQACAELILEKIKDPSTPIRTIVMDAELKYRESTEGVTF